MSSFRLLLKRPALKGLALALLFTATSSATTVTFDQFSDSTTLTTQISGLTFTNTTVISAGISLNELEFPPHSGTNAAFDDGGPITITFASPISAFSAYFTYTVPITVTGYNASNTNVAQTTSAFTANIVGDPGTTPNELLSLSSASGLSSILITGAPTGSSFVMDDITTNPVASIGAPEPILLLPLGLLLLAARIRSNATRN